MLGAGTYVSNRASDKLTELTDSVWLLRSGSAADCQVVADYGVHAAHRPFALQCHCQVLPRHVLAASTHPEWPGRHVMSELQ